MEALIIRLDAPLMSFGAPMIDRHGKGPPDPALSMTTGMLVNALGYDHTDYQRLRTLQNRINYASRQDRAGQQIQDYQTVDLSQEFMLDKNAWTTLGWIDKRKGGSASKGTRSEEHTSELQSRGHLVCRLLLEKKKQNKQSPGRRLK